MADAVERSRPNRRNVPFVFVPGYGRESLPQAYPAFVSKPFSRDSLLEAISAILVFNGEVVRLREQSMQDGLAREPPATARLGRRAV